MVRDVESTGRRRDIQGLRAIAVVLVVVFHAGLPLPGGYLGVDVFFVISGFVITAMLERDRTADRIVDLRRFYRRRFQRLTPALVVMVVVTVLAALLLLTPFGALQEAAKTGLGALLLVANFVIALTTGNYFDAAAERNPLLHTWSLSVEEQIYLVFPALVIGAWWLVRRTGRSRVWVPAVIAAAGAASLAITLARSMRGVTWGGPYLSGFYSPVTRLWEFVAGALLAYLVAWRPESPRLGSRTATALAAIGLVGLAVSAFVLDESFTTPGATTLIPVLATVGLLAAGSWAANPVSRMLGTRPFTWVGDRSYSIYLWHWPVIVFAAVLWPGSSTALVLAAVVSLAPSLASYRFVERPFRARTELRGRRFARVAALVVLPGLLVTAGGLVVADHVLAPWFRSGDGPIAHRGQIGWANTATGPFRNPCSGSEPSATGTEVGGVSPTCWTSESGRPVSLAVIGDSHALHTYDGLAHVLTGTNVLVFSANGVPVSANPQFTDVYAWAAGPDGPDAVLITYLWRRQVGTTDLRATIEQLEAAGRTVYLSDDVPDFSFGPELCKYDFVAPTRCTTPLADFTRDRRDYVDGLRQATRGTGATVMPTAAAFCDRTRCSMLVGDDLVYRDPNHLNHRGSRLLARTLVAGAPALRNLAPAPG